MRWVFPLVVILTIPLALAYDNSNTNDTALIESDKKYYGGFSLELVRVNVTNLLGTVEKINVSILTDTVDTVYLKEAYIRENVTILVNVTNCTSIDNETGNCTSITWDLVENHTLIWRKLKVYECSIKKDLYCVGEVRDIDIGPYEKRSFKFIIEHPPQSHGKFYIFVNSSSGRLYGMLDPWWNSSWPYRRKIDFLVKETKRLKDDLVINLTLDTASLIAQGKMREDCGDVRFTYLNVTSGEEIELPYWLVKGCNTSRTIFLVRIENVTEARNLSIYVYYGNKNATDMSRKWDVVWSFVDSSFEEWKVSDDYHNHNYESVNYITSYLQGLWIPTGWSCRNFVPSDALTDGEISGYRYTCWTTAVAAYVHKNVSGTGNLMHISIRGYWRQTEKCAHRRAFNIWFIEPCLKSNLKIYYEKYPHCDCSARCYGYGKYVRPFKAFRLYQEAINGWEYFLVQELKLNKTSGQVYWETIGNVTDLCIGKGESCTDVIELRLNLSEFYLYNFTSGKYYSVGMPDKILMVIMEGQSRNRETCPYYWQEWKQYKFWLDDVWSIPYDPSWNVTIGPEEIYQTTRIIAPDFEIVNTTTLKIEVRYEGYNTTLGKWLPLGPENGSWCFIGGFRHAEYMYYNFSSKNWTYIAHGLKNNTNYTWAVQCWVFNSTFFKPAYYEDNFTVIIPKYKIHLPPGLVLKNRYGQIVSELHKGIYTLYFEYQGVTIGKIKAEIKNDFKPNVVYDVGENGTKVVFKYHPPGLCIANYVLCKRNCSRQYKAGNITLRQLMECRMECHNELQECLLQAYPIEKELIIKAVEDSGKVLICPHAKIVEQIYEGCPDEEIIYTESEEPEEAVTYRHYRIKGKGTGGAELPRKFVPSLATTLMLARINIIMQGDILRLENPTYAGREATVLIVVTDLLGREVKRIQRKIMLPALSSWEIDLKELELPPGAYLVSVTVTADGQTFTRSMRLTIMKPKILTVMDIKAKYFKGEISAMEAFRLLRERVGLIRALFLVLYWVLSR